jgi:hypothetical protein
MTAPIRNSGLIDSNEWTIAEGDTKRNRRKMIRIPMVKRMKNLNGLGSIISAKFELIINNII